MVTLATDFASWGKAAVRRIILMTNKYGVICSDTVFSDRKRG